MSLLAEKLIELRGSKTLYKLGQESGIARALLSQYESGKLIPTREALKTLATYYGVDYNELCVLRFEATLSEPEDQADALLWAAQQRQAPIIPTNSSSALAKYSLNEQQVLLTSFAELIR